MKIDSLHFLGKFNLKEGIDGGGSIEWNDWENLFRKGRMETPGKVTFWVLSKGSTSWYLSLISTTSYFKKCDFSGEWF